MVIQSLAILSFLPEESSCVHFVQGLALHERFESAGGDDHHVSSHSVHEQFLLRRFEKQCEQLTRTRTHGSCRKELVGGYLCSRTSLHSMTSRHM